jgi:hypothetical protein
LRGALLRGAACLALIGTLLGGGGVTAAQTPQSANLLANPSFEEGMYHASMSNFIANGWSYWYQGRAAEDTRGWYLPEPEYGIISDRQGQSRSGSKSQRWFNTWAIHNAGVYQRVNVPADSWVKFSIWMFNWSSQEDVFGVSEAFHHKWVGIDPNGGVDPFSPNVVWGNEDQTMDVWVQLGVIARAKGETVTVFVRETPEYSVKHNDVLLDDAELVVIAPPPGGVAVQPIAAATRSADKADNTTAEKALELGRNAIAATIPGGGGEQYQYYKFKYPGGDDTPYRINIQASPDDGAVLSKFNFRVYGPRQGNVYVTGGQQRGLRPNVAGDLLVGEPGTYVVQVSNTNPMPISYRIWLTGKGVVGEVAAEAAPTPTVVSNPATAPPPTVPGPGPLGVPILPAPAVVPGPAVTQPAPDAAAPAPAGGQAEGQAPSP